MVELKAPTRRSRGNGVPKPVGQFHGYPVLGSVEIADAGERQRIIAALKDGIAHGGPQAACWWPRHGLRVVENGQAIEYLICFECRQFSEFQGDRIIRQHKAISPDMRLMLDRTLKNAGVPIAPE